MRNHNSAYDCRDFREIHTHTRLHRPRFHHNEKAAENMAFRSVKVDLSAKRGEASALHAVRQAKYSALSSLLVTDLSEATTPMASLYASGGGAVLMLVRRMG